MKKDERRDGVRFLTDLRVLLRPEKGGRPFDDSATAHDVSLKGFRVETSSKDIEAATTIRFTLDLQRGARASGKGRVVWAKRETFATWAGVEITEMAWADRRRLKQMLHPDSVDWTSLTNLVVKCAMLITVTLAAQRILTSPELRKLLLVLSPKIAAVCLLAWAVANFIKGDRR